MGITLNLSSNTSCTAYSILTMGSLVIFSSLSFPICEMVVIVTASPFHGEEQMIQEERLGNPVFGI